MNWWTQELPDLAGTGSNLLARVDRDRRVKFLEHAVRARMLWYSQRRHERSTLLTGILAQRSG